MKKVSRRCEASGYFFCLKTRTREPFLLSLLGLICLLPNMPIMPIITTPREKIKGSKQPATKCASNMLPCLSCIERLPAS